MLTRNKTFGLTQFKVKTVLNTAPIIPNMPEDLYKYSDIICANETELETMTNMHVDSLEEVEAAAKVLMQKGVKEVVVTLGERGSFYANKDGCKHVPIEDKIKVCIILLTIL